MHEMAIADALLRMILELTKDCTDRPISARISCGQLNAVNPDALCFAFDVLAKGTRCEGMRLDIQIIPFQASCKGCGHVYDIEQQYRCPRCGRDQFVLMPEQPLVLESVDFEGD